MGLKSPAGDKHCDVGLCFTTQAFFFIFRQGTLSKWIDVKERTGVYNEQGCNEQRHNEQG